MARETEGVGGTGVCVGVAVGATDVGVGDVRVGAALPGGRPVCWVLEKELDGAWLNVTAVGDGVAVGGGVDVLVGVGVGDGLPPQPTSTVDKSTSAPSVNASKKVGSAARDARRATGVRSINLFLLLEQSSRQCIGDADGPGSARSAGYQEHPSVAGAEYRRTGDLSSTRPRRVRCTFPSALHLC